MHSAPANDVLNAMHSMIARICVEILMLALPGSGE